MDELLEALNAVADAGTDSLIEESDIKQWFIERAVAMLSDEQKQNLAAQFKDAVMIGDYPFSDVVPAFADNAIRGLTPLLR